MSIPKIIWQINKEPYDQLPNHIRIMTDTWKESGWDYRYMSNQEAAEYIEKSCGLKFREMYEYIEMPSCKSDFWRYIVLYMFGGLYVDIDTVCLKPIESWINLEAELNVCEERFEEIGHTTYGPWLVATPQKSRFALKMIRKMEDFIVWAMKDQRPVTPDDVGPKAWTEAIQNMIDDSVNLIHVPGNVHHYMGNISWSDMSGRTPENLIWGVDNYNMKFTNEGYNSVGREITWG